MSVPLPEVLFSEFAAWRLQVRFQPHQPDLESKYPPLQ